MKKRKEKEASIISHSILFSLLHKHKRTDIPPQHASYTHTNTQSQSILLLLMLLLYPREGEGEIEWNGKSGGGCEGDERE